MGWDQDICRNSVRDFLLELMEIDSAKIIREALDLKMGEVGLTYEEEEAEGREEGDGLVHAFTPRVLRLSDGRVFIETLTETTCGDDWGSDFYDFVEVGKSFEFTRNENFYDMDGDGENRVVTTKEERISTYKHPGPGSDRRAAVKHTKQMQHHPECNDITSCHPDCAVAEARAPEISFGERKKFTPDEVRASGVFGEFVADYMEDHGLDHISLPFNDDAPTPDDLRKMAGKKDSSDE
jgi:hypothetical protein